MEPPASNAPINQKCTLQKCTLQHPSLALEYELFFTKRRSLEISVHPGARVIVRVPLNTSLETIENRIIQKASWIKRQMNYFSRFPARNIERKYTQGESHYFLGQPHPLEILASSRNHVALHNGHFHIESRNDTIAHIQKLLESWYRDAAMKHFPQMLDDCWDDCSSTPLHGFPHNRLKSLPGGFNSDNYSRPPLKIRKMTRRWGSLSSTGRMTLNTNLIKAPGECIEYVIIHELCHLVHLNHGREFYVLLDRTMPDWKERKHRLEMSPR